MKDLHRLRTQSYTPT
jgi:hypothetical protein